MRREKMSSFRAMIVIALLASGSAHAGFEQFNGPSGAMNVWTLTEEGTRADWLFYSVWGINDLQSITTDDRTFELLPNINTYAEALVGTDEQRSIWTDSPDGGVTAGPDGNRWMDASTLFEIPSITNNETSATFSFDVDTYDLNARYSVEGFIQVLNPGTDYSASVKDTVAITNVGSHTLSIEILPSMTGQILQAGWVLSGINANPATNWGSVTVKATALFADVGDVDAPSPDPMSFAIAPYAVSDQTIKMAAATATDELPVEYYFTCISGGGNDSGWQSSTNYVDSGLAAGTEYTYTVTARDTSVAQNETAASDPASVTTNPSDTVPPAPSPMTFATAPVASPVSVLLTATTATDDSGVEYYFTCTSGNGNDSGWQSSPIYVDIGLVPNSNYAYTVSARDFSAATNETIASDAVMVTTASTEKWMVNSLSGYTGDSTQPTTSIDLAIDDLEDGSSSETAVISFDGTGATFGEGTDYQGRNILRTIAVNYNDSSFEAYATYIFDGTWDQAAFVGMGQGVLTGEPGNWGVPELNLEGVNGIVGEIKTSLSAGVPQGCNVLKIIGGGVSTNTFSNPVETNDTFRVKLAYDAITETATISVDTNYAGGTFVEDRILGEFSAASPTNSMWDGKPVRVYVGGGEGTVISDLVIRALPSDVVVDDLTAEQVPGGMAVAWGGSAGQVFEVQYTTDLIFGTWLPDPTIGDIYDITGAALSATSTVDAAQVFYQVITK